MPTRPLPPNITYYDLYTNEISGSEVVPITVDITKIDVGDIVFLWRTSAPSTGFAVINVEYFDLVNSQNYNSDSIISLYYSKITNEIHSELSNYLAQNNVNKPLSSASNFHIASYVVVKNGKMRAKQTTLTDSSFDRLRWTAWISPDYPNSLSLAGVSGVEFGGVTPSFPPLYYGWQRLDNIIRTGTISSSSKQISHDLLYDLTQFGNGLYDVRSYTSPRYLVSTVVGIVSEDLYNDKSFLANSYTLNSASTTQESDIAKVVETRVQTSNLEPSRPNELDNEDLYLILRINSLSSNGTALTDFTQLTSGTAYYNRGTANGTAWEYVEDVMFYWDLNYRWAGTADFNEPLDSHALGDNEIYLSALVRNAYGYNSANFLNGQVIENNIYSSGTVTYPNQPDWLEAPTVNQIDMDGVFETVLSFAAKLKPINESASSYFEETQFFKIPYSTTKKVDHNNLINGVNLTTAVGYYEGIDKLTVPTYSFAYKNSIDGAYDFSGEDVLENTWNSWTLTLRVKGKGFQGH